MLYQEALQVLFNSTDNLSTSSIPCGKRVDNSESLDVTERLTASKERSGCLKLTSCKRTQGIKFTHSKRISINDDDKTRQTTGKADKQSESIVS